MRLAIGIARKFHWEGKSSSTLKHVIDHMDLQNENTYFYNNSFSNIGQAL